MSRNGARGGRIRIADLFCGAGGTSTGAVQACEELGLKVDLTAVNHWDIAVATHAANHPHARHLCESLDTVNPRDLFSPGELDVLWASPECTHHSNARGGMPINDQSRVTAWCVIRWAEALRPKIIFIENVAEFESWGPIGSNGRPLKTRRGEVFNAWVTALESLGYRVDWRVLRAADYVGLHVVNLVARDPAVRAVAIHRSNPGEKNDEIRAAAVANGVAVIEFDPNVNSDCGKSIRDKLPDLLVLAWWPSRLNEDYLAMPRLGALNLHPSFLPWCRGKHTTFWTLVENVPFGITIHWVVEKLDAGEIAFQERVDVLETDTSEDLHLRARMRMLALFHRVWPRIRVGDIPRRPNRIDQGSYHESAEIEEASRIDLDGVYSARRLLTMLRARTFWPHPACWFMDKGVRYEVRVSIERVER